MQEWVYPITSICSRRCDMFACWFLRNLSLLDSFSHYFQGTYPQMEDIMLTQCFLGRADADSLKVRKLVGAFFGGWGKMLASKQARFGAAMVPAGEKSQTHRNSMISSLLRHGGRPNFVSCPFREQAVLRANSSNLPTAGAPQSKPG